MYFIGSKCCKHLTMHRTSPHNKELSTAQHSEKPWSTDNNEWLGWNLGKYTSFKCCYYRASRQRIEVCFHWSWRFRETWAFQNCNVVSLTPNVCIPSFSVTPFPINALYFTKEFGEAVKSTYVVILKPAQLNFRFDFQQD